MNAEKKHVLIVDDDEIVRLIIAKVVEKRGVETTMAKNGAEAVRLLDGTRRFDLIFLDLMMPDVTGWEVLDAINANDATRNTPVVILSGAPVSKAERNRLSKRVSAFLDKQSFSVAEFEKMVEGLLTSPA